RSTRRGRVGRRGVRGPERRGVRCEQAAAVSSPQAALDLLVSILDLEELELNLFRGRTPKEDRLRVFGGQVAGQALVAAGRTVDTGAVNHSLHAYFLRPGDPSIPILY